MTMIVKQYSRRRVRYAADKESAFLSLVSGLRRLWTERQDKANYVAGLLISTQTETAYWVQQLVRFRQDLGSDGHRAPRQPAQCFP